MAVTRVLIVASTYPLPSRSYDELVCTAGLLANGDWVRIYPVPLSFLSHHKYEWIEIDLIKREAASDFRPESYRPRYTDLRDVKILDHVDTKQNWLKRKELCLKTVYRDMSQLVEDSTSPKNVSLAVFTPTKITKFQAIPDSTEWPEKWQAQLNQFDLFANTDGTAQTAPRTPIEKIPFKFQYAFEDCNGKPSTMTIEDWEIGALYRNCLRQFDGNVEKAKKGVEIRYDEEFLTKNDISFFLGTTLQHHRARHLNPFTIIGVFYPMKEVQESLF